MGFFSRLLGNPPPSSSPARPAPSRHAAPEPQPEPEAEQGGLVEHFTEDHRACDARWAEVEGVSDDPARFAEGLATFDRVMRRHLAMEEEVLFPAFEAATGMVGGPTQMMRMEHVQMRAVLDEMRRLGAAGDTRGVLDQGDTLLMLIQQHNVKEENMLYPMAAEFLGHGWAELKGALARY